MGLDMYLKGEIYLSRNFGNEEELDNVRKVADVPKPYDDSVMDSVQVVYNLGYWRKDNHIHKWFVDNCQEGIDDCRMAYVDTEDLNKLLNDIEDVLEDNSLADDLLPTQDGFFFGGTEYDKYYFDSLVRTKNMLNYILKTVDEYANKGNYLTLYYSSSW